MNGRRLLLGVDAEQLEVDFRQRIPRVIVRCTGAEPPPARGSIIMTTSRQTLLDLVDGKLSVITAIDQRSLRLWASASDLLAFDQGMTAYLHGAVRSGACTDLLTRFRDWAAAPSAGDAPQR